MPINRMMIIIASALMFSGCSEQSGLPDGLKESVTAWIEEVKQFKNERTAYNCQYGCREFRVICTREMPLGPADSPNGVTKKWLVEIEFAYFNNWYKKFYGTSRLALFENTKSGWNKAEEYDVPNVKKCMVF